MKKLSPLIMATYFIFNFGYSQNKKDWFLGMEIGNSTIISYKLDEPKNSLQTGILAEYFFNKIFSISGRIKYFKTGVSFNNGYKPSIGHFNGSVICIPLNANANFNFGDKVYPTIKAGIVWNKEIESNYTYSNNYPKSFLSLNLGIGANYALSKKSIFYSNIEGYFFGGFKGSSDQFIIKRNFYTENILLNFGIKHNISK